MALSTDLVAYYSLADLTDATGRGNTLTNNGSANFVTGKVGNAVDLELGSSQYLSMASNADVAMTNQDFTIAGWINLESVNSNRTMVSRWNGTGNQRSYAVDFLSASSKIRFAVSVDGTNTGAGIATSTASLSTATWYFIVAWHDSVANTVNIKVNDGATDSASYSSGPFNSTAIFSVGSQAGATPTFDGLIDEVGVWKRVLTGAEITDLYNGGSGRDYAYISAGGTTYNQSAAGTLTNAGTVARSTSKTFAGTLTSAGAVVKAITKSAAGTLTSGGAIVKAIAKSVTGALTSDGALAKNTVKTFVGTLSSAGALTAARTFLLSLAGTLTSAGALSRNTAKNLDGTLTMTGLIGRAISKAIGGTLAFLGALIGGIVGAESNLLDVEISDSAVTAIAMSDGAAYTITLSDTTRS